MTRSKIYNYNKEELQELLDTSYSLSDVVRKIGLKGGSSIETLKRIIGEYSLSTEKLHENYLIYQKNVSSQRLPHNEPTDVSVYLVKNGIRISGHNLKRKLFASGFKEERCEICGNDTWLGQKIKFHLHHIDGDHDNNELENLQILCPNCHSFTDNYGVYNSAKYKENKSNY